MARRVQVDYPARFAYSFQTKSTHTTHPELVDDYWGLCLENHFRGRLVGTQSWEIAFVITKLSRKCARLRMLKGQVESSAIKDC